MEVGGEGLCGGGREGSMRAYLIVNGVKLSEDNTYMCGMSVVWKW